MRSNEGEVIIGEIYVSENMGRLAQDMKREVIAIIGRLKDPRLEGGLLTVTRLDVTPDLDVAKVYVSVMGREDGPKRSEEHTSELQSR